MPQLKESMGWKYVITSKLTRENLFFSSHLTISPAPLYKVYTNCERVMVSPSVENKGLGKLLSKRRSWRRYLPLPIALEDLCYILWCGYGNTKKKGDFFFRTSPSAGALYPLEIYIFSFNITSLSPGIYHYSVKDNCLEFLIEGDFSSYLISACMGQSFVGRGACCIVISAVFRRNMSKYRDRGVRYIFLDAGHLAQNMILGAGERGIGTCPVGAFFDDEVNGLLGLDGEEESVIYLISMGRVEDK